MSRPLVANKARETEAALFHRSVFKAHGQSCWNCGSHATDAAHVIPRSQIGPKLRYACPVHNGRPACRRCHDRQERGEINFPLRVRKIAVRALNKLNPKVPLMEPAA